MSKRHALVTGAGSGIGKAIALALAADGHVVSLAGRRPMPLEAARDEIVAAGGQAFVRAGFDVTKPEAVERGIAAAIAEAGDIAVLVNCAGEAPSAPFEKTDAKTWDLLWRTNVMGAVHAARAVLPGMRALPAGRIVNIASTASLRGYAYVSAYTATKHALLGMTRALALELARTRITVNAVCPGYTDTDIIRDAVGHIVAKTGRSEAEALETFTKTNPQGRLIDPAEVANTVLWLLSDGARSVTGQATVVAGGEIM